jgi:hypothetical protein
MVAENFRDHVTFNLQSTNNWRDIDLLNNEIAVAENEPEYISDLKSKLSRKRLDTGTNVVKVGALDFCVPQSNESPKLERLAPYLPLEVYFEGSTPTDTNASTDNLREVTSIEVSHYSCILEQPFLQDHKEFKRQKEAQVHALLCALTHHVGRIGVHREPPCLKL